jgi:hypothetical protein
MVSIFLNAFNHSKCYETYAQVLKYPYDPNDDREDETDSSLGRRIAEARADYASGHGRDFDEFLSEIEP